MTWEKRPGRPVLRSLLAAIALSFLAAAPVGAKADAGLPALTARALFLPEAAAFDIVRPIYASGAAIVEEIKAAPDEVVKKDQVLLLLRSPLLEAEIATAQSSLQRHSDYLQKLTELATQYQAAIEALEAERREQLNEAIAAIEQERDGYKTLLDSKKGLRTKGLETSTATFQAEVQYNQSRSELAKQKLALLEVDQRLAQMREQIYEKLAPESREVEEERIALSDLEAQYAVLRTIRAPRDGLVNSVFVSLGSSVDTRDVLMTLSGSSPVLDVFAFVGIADAPRLKAGMAVSVVPAHARAGDGAPLAGTVQSISRTPLSKPEAQNIFFDESTAAYFTQDAVVYLVRVSLDGHASDGTVGPGDLATLVVDGPVAGEETTKSGKGQ